MDRHRWGVAVCHRRFGKTVCAINHLQRAALTCPKPRPRFAYIAPYRTQGKSIAWDYCKHYAAAIPGVEVNESELRIDYPNGGQLRIFGADNEDALRGLYLDGAIMDEYGLMSPTVFPEVIRPALSDREGWAFFKGTPSGKNQFYDVAQLAQETAGWFFRAFKASETGILPPAELASARQSMTADEYAQEYECSFEASVKGAIYARELQAARESGRIAHVPYEPRLPVDTDWDLGIGDATAIWFSQSSPTGEVRVIDYYEQSGMGLHHYAGILRDKGQSLGYQYGTHWGPHDIEVRELGSGQSRIEIGRDLGLYFRTAKRMPLEDGINAARMLLPRCWFDATRCRQGLESLGGYHWDYNTRINEYKPIPVHDHFSHGADAFRTLATRHFTPRQEARLNDSRKDLDPADRYRRKPESGTASRGGW